MSFIFVEVDNLTAEYFYFICQIIGGRGLTYFGSISCYLSFMCFNSFHEYYLLVGWLLVRFVDVYGKSKFHIYKKDKWI